MRKYLVPIVLSSCGGASPVAKKPVEALPVADVKPARELPAVCKDVTGSVPQASKPKAPPPPLNTAPTPTGAATMAEMETFFANHQHIEVLRIASDVMPASRSNSWLAMVAKSAKAAVENTRAESSDASAVAMVEYLLSLYPDLADHHDFNEGLETVIAGSLRRCWGGCGEEASRLMNRFGAKFEIAKAIADAIYDGNNKYYATPYYLSLAVLHHNPTGANGFCSDEKLVDATMYGLSTPYDNETAISARELAGRWCRSSLEPKIYAELTSKEPNSYVVSNGCPVLKLGAR